MVPALTDREVIVTVENCKVRGNGLLYITCCSCTEGLLPKGDLALDAHCGVENCGVGAWVADYCSIGFAREGIGWL